MLLFIFSLPISVSHAADGDGESLLLEVPFMTQAPTFKWSNDRFQSGCEEASVLMALAWAGVQPLAKTRERQERAILDLVRFEKEKYSVYYDTSTQDTIRFASEYSGFKGFSLQRNIGWRDILRSLEKGFLVIVPADGRVLQNPNFKGRGPQEHMLVIRGYDYTTQEFITNDPGTRMGEKYRYHRKVLFAAIRDYKTGHKEKGRPRTKSMIVAAKEAKKH